jgi:chemotaxis methyl-accepting protein methylase
MTIQALEEWLSAATGIELARGGVGRVLDNVVQDRCRALGCGPEEYFLRAREVASGEFELLANAITVVYTWFFRDRGQLAAVEGILQELSQGRPVRVWVPGCATGEDCFSIALLAARLGVPVSILGTDLNTRALACARRGRYPKSTMREVDATSMNSFVRHEDRSYEVDASLRANVRFERHNLADPVPSLDGSSAWDLVLCRNVLIYFQPERVLEVFDRLMRALVPGGYMMFGASEVVYDVPRGLEALYVAGRLALRKATPEPKGQANGPTNGAAKGAGTPRTARHTSIPQSRGKRHHGPLPALPSRVGQLSSELTGAVSALPVTPGAPKAEAVTIARLDRGRLERALQRGHQFLDEGQLAEALEQYELAVGVDSTCPQSQMYKGVTRYLCGDVEGAAHDLRAALFLDGALWPAAFYLALSYESMGLPDDALREFRHVVRLGERELRQPGTAPQLLALWRHDVLELAERRLRGGGASVPPPPRA